MTNRSRSLPQLQPSNSNSADLPGANTPTPTDPLPSPYGSSTPEHPRIPLDLGEDKLNQVKKFSSSFSSHDLRSFVVSWYKSWEYSVEVDAAFVFRVENT